MNTLRCTLLFCAISCVPLQAADELTVGAGPIDGVESSQMLHAYLMQRVQQAVERRQERYDSINSAEQIAAYQQQLRQFMLDQIGGLPQRTPLNAQVVGREDRDGYRIEKVIFESQPRHFVTAILYLPQAKPPYPGVLVPCGHSANGKARDLYQRAPIVMAQSGMAALCYDPLDQGERHQLLDKQGKPLITQSTQGHNLAGVGACLVGRNTATYRIWDGMRAIDYLASRPEVDPQRIGCTGISGGGTMTSYLMALDERVQAAAPGCYLTSYLRLLQTIGPQDAEQTIAGQVAFGLDHADYLLMRAAKPTLMMTATKDYFDIDGAWDTFRQAKRWYGRMGCPERVDMIEVDSQHGFPTEMRVAAARWMRRWLLDQDDAVTEREFEVATDEQLLCTPLGEVMLLQGARSVYDLNGDVETELAGQRKQWWASADPQSARDKVREVCGIAHLEELPQVTSQQAGTVQRSGYRIDQLVLRTEPGIWLPALLFVPDQPATGATLYLHEDGKSADTAIGGRIEQLVQQGQLVLAPDLRGVGETLPQGKHSYARYLPPIWRDSTIAYLLGKSLLAMRCEDVLVCARYLGSHGAAPSGQGVRVESVGRVGVAALHAVAVEPQLFDHLRLRRCLVSWSNVVHTPLSQNQWANAVHGVLRSYDLPDLRGMLPPGTLEFLEPLDAAEQATR